MIKSGSLQENFEIALEKVDVLTEHNERLMDIIANLEYKLAQSKEPVITPEPEQNLNNNKRLQEISEGAERAIERYKQFLNKEFPNAKSKQSKRQSV
tara:strand:+ start:790 stop:1080 length:291 start_codon:yes stop_codon:yes gene_type:complete